ncbi:hypothetical protein EGR_05413 [Echinococcus granulosus]|uniref:Uncharacterized protein n=1 Tax=Echinococcus granulosus TaxID=6210 RepID=W6UFB1_ECHGR|nr:hypothetical protein EGR_05413 [Echinococcus granulosus]EUB59793.1 hypothetical protein EGR_05413 [Echinococcus granulosus]
MVCNWKRNKVDETVLIFPPSIPKYDVRSQWAAINLPFHGPAIHDSFQKVTGIDRSHFRCFIKSCHAIMADVIFSHHPSLPTLPTSTSPTGYASKDISQKVEQPQSDSTIFDHNGSLISAIVG